MPAKRYPNGMVIYSYLNKYEMAAYAARNRSGGAAAIPMAASLKKVRDIVVRLDNPSSDVSAARSEIPRKDIMED